MSTAPVPNVLLGDHDRLSMTMFLAMAVHAVVILGIGFSVNLSLAEKFPSTLDIILVQTRSDAPPDNAKRLAQHHQQASGQSTDDKKPTSSVTSPDLIGQGTISQNQQSAQKQQQQEQKQRVIVAKQAETKQHRDVLTKSKQNQTSIQELLQRSLEIARLSSELAQEEQHYAKRPRIRYLNAISARSAVEAAYIQTWIEKVERVGNLNYPDEAIRKKLSGILTLSVSVDFNGNIVKISVDHSSGQQVLDDAAMRIVQQSSPFADFPADMRREYDQLMITRSWIFHSDHSLATQ